MAQTLVDVNTPCIVGEITVYQLVLSCCYQKPIFACCVHLTLFHITTVDQSWCRFQSPVPQHNVTILHNVLGTNILQPSRPGFGEDVYELVMFVLPEFKVVTAAPHHVVVCTVTWVFGIVWQIQLIDFSQVILCIWK